MDPQIAYTLRLRRDLNSALVESVFTRVWRHDFTEPRFCLLTAEPGMDSWTLRRLMVALKEGLSDILAQRTGERFVFRSMARFDQQVTTKFHLDGAPLQSIFILGYEPSRVRSRLFLADYTQAAFDLGISPAQFLSEYNPMYRNGEEQLARYTTELPQPETDQARIVVINNSSLSFSNLRADSLGVMHKAIIEYPDDTLRRIVNSTMLVTEGSDLTGDQQMEFVRTDKISPRNY